jgi:hypothetical protein
MYPGYPGYAIVMPTSSKRDWEEIQARPDADVSMMLARLGSE